MLVALFRLLVLLFWFFPLDLICLLLRKGALCASGTYCEHQAGPGLTNRPASAGIKVYITMPGTSFVFSGNQFNRA